MDWILRAAASVAITLALAGPTAAILGDNPAPQDESATTTEAANTCHFRVTADEVNVRTGPDRTATVIKQQIKGDGVTGPCHTIFNDGRRWTEVHLDGGETAWMARSMLHYEYRS
jgi:uncharacterized protein YgiM (DUF1202 family)